METFINSGIGIAVLSGISMAGLLSKLFTNIKLNKLLKQTKNPGETKDRQLKQWKFKFENTYRMCRGMNNVLVYIKKNFVQYRVWGVSIQKLDRVNVTLSGVIGLTSLALAILAVKQKMSIDITVMYCSTGILLAGIMLLWERICCTAHKKEYIINNLQDYYENTLVKKLELGNELRNAEVPAKPVEVLQTENKKVKKYTPIQENVHLTETESRRKAFRNTPDEEKENRYGISGADSTGLKRNSEKMRKDVEYLKQSLDRIAAGRETEYVRPTRKLTENEEKLIEEFIKEYL